MPRRMQSGVTQPPEDHGRPRHRRAPRAPGRAGAARGVHARAVQVAQGVQAAPGRDPRRDGPGDQGAGRRGHGAADGDAQARRPAAARAGRHLAARPHQGPGDQVRCAVPRPDGGQHRPVGGAPHRRQAGAPLLGDPRALRRGQAAGRHGRPAEPPRPAGPRDPHRLQHPRRDLERRGHLQGDQSTPTASATSARTPRRRRSRPSSTSPSPTSATPPKRRRSSSSSTT